MRQRQAENKKAWKVEEIKTAEHREVETRIWMRIAKERKVDIPNLIGEEYKELKDIHSDEIRQKFLDEMDSGDEQQE